MQQTQKRLIEQNDELRRARQQELVKLEKKFKAAQQEIYEQMRAESENFAQLSLQTTQQIQEVESALSKSGRKIQKLQKHKALVEQREKHVAQLTSEYRANAAQLAHECMYR